VVQAFFLHACTLEACITPAARVTCGLVPSGIVDSCPFELPAWNSALMIDDENCDRREFTHGDADAEGVDARAHGAPAHRAECGQETGTTTGEVRSRSRFSRPHPLGPLWSMVSLDSPIGGRVYAACLFAAVVAVFVVAARLHPDGRQQGTHQQLGLPPCGFAVVAGLPCPTCGMTTAFAHTIRGQLLQAAHAQVAGLLLALGTLAVGGVALYATITGRRPALNWYRINPMHVLWLSCGLFVAAWAVKILLILLERGREARF